MGPPWWSGTIGYQVYIRSFADGTGDGLGDLRGLADRLDHLAWLGVDVVWITPFYPSPMRDAGYDVVDHCDVDPRFGTLADVDAVVARAHELGLRVLIDLVPNHTSSDHRWFQQSRSSRENPYRDYYLWRDPAPDGGPPNNWPAHFGGPAWTLDERTGQYWCHLFLPEQPDLNWRDPRVADEFEAILRFWFDRGVDGFRIDVAHALVKRPDFPDLPPAPDPHPVEGPGFRSDFGRFDHIYDVDQPEIPEVYRRWRRVADAYDALLLGEVYLLEPQRVRRYVADQQGLHLSFWFKPLHCSWDVTELRTALREGVEEVGPWVAWPLSSHDRARAATAFGGGQAGKERALVLATLLFCLPGVPFIYQGEELGLEDGDVPSELMQDPIAVFGEPEHSRDGSRTPMPWEPRPGWGFTTAGQPWLPFGNRVPEETVAAQCDDPRSWLHRYRALVAARKALADLTEAPVTWLPADEPIIAYRRGRVAVAGNTADDARTLSLPPGRWRVAFAVDLDREGVELEGDVRLAAREALIFAAV